MVGISVGTRTFREGSSLQQKYSSHIESHTEDINFC
uniref:Uncharacterized protein n=1 Tax=virus sp. ctBM815 TaxID=2825806 RepID=A0A8S5RKM7_9VIRU|nr:MAG TPA: hypothetical protein [virus sp. ctBM815]DAV23862.1 MAG TPA: hypothetical protein [Bacteriophage sp.]